MTATLNIALRMPMEIFLGIGIRVTAFSGSYTTPLLQMKCRTPAPTSSRDR
jgi:hypothetical protein